MYLYLVYVMFSSELNNTYLHVAGRSMIYLKKNKKKTVKIWSGKGFESQDSKRWCRPSFIRILQSGCQSTKSKFQRWCDANPQEMPCGDLEE